jgi:hypothetical protein
VNTHYWLTDLESGRIGAQRRDGAGVTMAERSRHGNLRMAARERLAVSAAGKCEVDS